jgi:hypothetical protein
MPTPIDEATALKAWFSRRGKAGVAARLAKQSPERRREIALIASRARWRKGSDALAPQQPDADLPDATDAALAMCVKPVLAHPRTEARFQIATQTARRSGVAVGALVELVHHWPLLPEPVRAAIEDEPERLLGPAVPLLLAIVRRYLDPTDTR